MLERCRTAQIKDKYLNLNSETSPAWFWSIQPCILLHRFLTHRMASAFNKFRVFLFWGPSRYARKVYNSTNQRKRSKLEFRNLSCMILTPTVNNTLQAEFWNFRSESSRSRRVHGRSWENLTSRVQMTCICKPQWRVHPQFSPHIPVRPRVCKLWTVLTLEFFACFLESWRHKNAQRVVA